MQVHINLKKFFEGYRRAFGRLSQEQVDGLTFLLSSIDHKLGIYPISYKAYMLATIYHETAKTFQPIEEYGKGRRRPYGKVDPLTKKAYYGRGYIQLTWKANYQAFETLLKLPLVKNPEKALDPVIAFEIAQLGMIGGMFTGKRLSDYITSTRTDYVNARKVVNGLDKAAMIAGYAKKFEDILTQAISSTIIENSIPPDKGPQPSEGAPSPGVDDGWLTRIISRILSWNAGTPG